MNAAARFWRDDRRPIRSKWRRNARPTIAIAPKGNQDGQTEGATRHYSRVDGTCAREATILSAGAGFCRSRDSTAQPAAQSPNAAGRDHGMAAATHRPALTGGKRLLWAA